MSEQSVLGCGRFSESDWADVIIEEDAGRSAPLVEHARQCASCRSELNAFASLAADVRRVTRVERPTRAAFAEGVLAAVQHERLRHAPSRPPGAARPGSAQWWHLRPAAVAFAAVFTVFVVLGAGLWSWPWSSVRSTGEVLPGGVIVKATNGGSSTVHAASLSADAAVEAVAGSGTEAEGDGTARTIRVTLGMLAGVSTSSGEANKNDHQGSVSPR